MGDKKLTIIVMGSSGCGKGTQIKLIEEKLNKHGIRYLYFEAGSQIRDFLKSTSFSAKHAVDIVKSGNLLPTFLPIYLWGDFLNKYYSEDQYLIFDGSPRTIIEAQIMETAFAFYGIKPIILYINTDDKVSEERMLSRGRVDDTQESIKNRIAFFKKDVVPTIEYFRESNKCNFVEINGNGGIEEIHENIIRKIFGNKL